MLPARIDKEGGGVEARGGNDGISRDESALVDKAWLALEIFIVNWSLAPHRWHYESDMSAEIARQINTLIGDSLSRVPWDDLEGKPCKCGQGSRVHLDYPIYSDGATTFPRGDVVMVADDPNKPYLWVCEVKSGSTDRSSDDETKVRRWLDGQPPEVRFGCVLDLKIVRGREPEPWSKPTIDGRFRRYQAEAFPPETSS